jgi:hypothetical protein
MPYEPISTYASLRMIQLIVKDFAETMALHTTPRWPVGSLTQLKVKVLIKARIRFVLNNQIARLTHAHKLGKLRLSRRT